VWVAFDAAKLSICRDNPDGSVSANFCKPGDDVLERARQTKTLPLTANVLDVDDVTQVIRYQWHGCLVAGKDEATARAMVASMFGEDWAYEYWPDGKGKYPARYLVVEVPDTMTFGCQWIADAVDGPPRAVGEAG
jgi:hypothetical protein